MSIDAPKGEQVVIREALDSGKVGFHEISVKATEELFK